MHLSHMEGIAARLAVGLGMVLAGALPLDCQTAAAPVREGIDSAPRVLLSAGGLASAPPPGQVLRAIDDPFNGARWLLLRNPEYPAGPARLLLVESGRSGLRQPTEAGDGRHDAVGAAPIPLRPVIRAGDRLVVEENTPVVAAHLEATALGPAAPGSPLAVRLRIGGRVVQTVALGPGRAAFVTPAEVRP